MNDLHIRKTINSPPYFQKREARGKERGAARVSL